MENVQWGKMCRKNRLGTMQMERGAKYSEGSEKKQGGVDGEVGEQMSHRRLGSMRGKDQEL